MIPSRRAASQTIAWDRPVTSRMDRRMTTPGKMVFKLTVVDASGGKISYGRAFGRSCAEILSQMICAIGYIIAAFDDQKRALHDHMCNTRVIYNR